MSWGKGNWNLQHFCMWRKVKTDLRENWVSPWATRAWLQVMFRLLASFSSDWQAVHSASHPRRQHQTFWSWNSARQTWYWHGTQLSLNTGGRLILRALSTVHKDYWKILPVFLYGSLWTDPYICPSLTTCPDKDLLVFLPLTLGKYLLMPPGDIVSWVAVSESWARSSSRWAVGILEELYVTDVWEFVPEAETWAICPVPSPSYFVCDTNAEHQESVYCRAGRWIREVLLCLLWPLYLFYLKSSLV